MQASPPGLDTAMNADPFRHRTLVTLAVVGGTGLLLMLLYMLFGPRPAGGDAQAAQLSRSALGYRAVVRFLEGDVPVRPARGVVPLAAHGGTPLVVLDPPPHRLPALRNTVADSVAGGVPMVVVLPKWTGEADFERPGWLAAVELRPVLEVAEALAAAVGNRAEETLADDGGGRLLVVRPSEAGPYSVAASPWAPEGGEEGGEAPGESGRPRRPDRSLHQDLPRPQLFRDGAGYFEPLVWAPEGILVARARDLPVYVVADPDLLNVAGLGRGDNALLVHRLLVAELAAQELYVQEGTFGALPPQASVWSGLLRPPLSTVALHLAVVAMLVTWVAAERFGRPRVPPPRVPPGKGTLIDNTARLLETAGDPRRALERYLELTARRAAERLGLPAGLAVRERLHRLDRIGRRRGARSRLKDHVIAVETLPGGKAGRRRAPQVATALHRWYGEVCDGGGDDR